MTPAILLLTGPPGAGKSTVAGLLAEGAGGPSVHIQADTFYDWIKSGFISPGLPESRHQNETVLSAIAETALAYWRGGYEVIVDGIIGPWFLPVFEAAFVNAGAPFAYIVLRAPEEISVARVLGRDRAQAEREMPVIRQLHESFRTIDAFETHVVDTAIGNPAEIARRIRDGLQEGRFWLRSPLPRERI